MKEDFNIAELIEYSKGGILSKDIIRTDKINVSLFCMSEGTEISDHRTTKEGFVYVVEGDGIFNLEGKEIRMSPGVFIPLKENALHSLKSIKNTAFLLVLA